MIPSAAVLAHHVDRLVQALGLQMFCFVIDLISPFFGLASIGAILTFIIPADTVGALVNRHGRHQKKTVVLIVLTKAAALIVSDNRKGS